MIGIRMHLEEETVGTERPGCPAMAGTNSRLPPVLPPAAPGRCTECVQSMTTVEAIPSMSGMLRKIDHQVVVAVHIATFGKPNLTGTGLHRLFIRVSHIFTRKELRFLDIDRTSRTGRSDQQIGLAAKECRNLDHIDDFADRSGLTGFVNVGHAAAVPTSTERRRASRPFSNPGPGTTKSTCGWPCRTKP